MRGMQLTRSCTLKPVARVLFMHLVRA